MRIDFEFRIVVLLEDDCVLSLVTTIERLLCHSLHRSVILAGIVEVSLLIPDS
jgi:hypothetical protein